MMRMDVTDIGEIHELTDIIRENEEEKLIQQKYPLGHCTNAWEHSFFELDTIRLRGICSGRCLFMCAQYGRNLIGESP